MLDMCSMASVSTGKQGKILFVISQEEGGQAAFPSSVGDLLTQCPPNLEDPCDISGLPYHPVRDCQVP